MKINQQLSELHALAEGIDKSNLWNVSITLIVLFIALCFAPISIFLKIIIYSSVSAVVGAIDNASRKQALADLKTQLYLRGLYYLYREGDLETSDKKELEELEELNQAIKDKNLKEVADSLTDILYVTYGAGHAFGIDLDECFNEVQRSNMSKLGSDGKPIYNEIGKVMKGPNYFKPDLSKFLK